MSLTLAEARHRATAIEVESYGIDLDLTGWERGRFACVTTVRFTTTEASTFLELTAAEDVSLESDVAALEPVQARRLDAVAHPTP
jgi:hypothetical protein